MFKSRLIKEILTERCPNGTRVYSQGRFYLLWSVLAYYITISFITIKSLKPEVDIDIKPFEIIIDALQWAMGLFAGYVFGAKGLEALKIVMSGKLGKQYSEPTPTVSAPPATPDPSEVP